MIYGAPLYTHKVSQSILMSLRQILWSVLANCNAESQCQRLVVAAYIKSHWKTTNDLMKQCPQETPFVIWVAGTRDIGRK